MTVRQIVKEYLEEHGFDGLACDECGCDLQNLIPCYECNVEDCQPGHKVRSKDGDWIIVAKGEKDE